MASEGGKWDDAEDAETAASWDEMLSNYDQSKTAAVFQKHGIPKQLGMLMILQNRIFNLMFEQHIQGETWDES